MATKHPPTPPRPETSLTWTADSLLELGRSYQAAAVFAVNMLVATEGGGTFTFEELREDLAVADFTQARVQRRDESMNCIVLARKPE